jgi:hypothetical protein
VTSAMTTPLDQAQRRNALFDAPGWTAATCASHRLTTTKLPRPVEPQTLSARSRADHLPEPVRGDERRGRAVSATPRPTPGPYAVASPSASLTTPSRRALSRSLLRPCHVPRSRWHPVSLSAEPRWTQRYMALAEYPDRYCVTRGSNRTTSVAVTANVLLPAVLRDWRGFFVAGGGRVSDPRSGFDPLRPCCGVSTVGSACAALVT